MKAKRICVPLIGIAVLLSTSSIRAEGWPNPFSGSQKKSTSTSASQTLKKLDAGTKKFFRGTVDVITLKPLWDNGKKQKRNPVDPWMRSTRRKTAKKSFWDSWFPREEPKKPATVGEWVGMPRPE